MSGEFSGGVIQPAALDRTRLAIGLRQAGVCVDFEDWDGLTDDDVRKRVQYKGLSSGPREDGRVVYHPEEQEPIITALFSADRAMLEREYIPDLFSQMIGGDHEV